MNENIKALIFIFWIIITPLITCGQFQRKVISEKVQNFYNNRNAIMLVKRSKFSDGVDLTNFLPEGYSKTGNVDYTLHLQKGIDQHRKVILPNFPILINFKGLRLKSNSSVLFLQNSKLILKANKEELYGLIYIENIRNVNVYFANLEGDRYRHLSDKGEWGMGFFIRDSENVNIEAPVINYMWGDGIYIGTFGSKYSKNINVSSAYINESRRNGISIISGENILVKNSFISNTYGHSPEYGIDIEPNSSKEKLVNIVLSNNKTFNNKGGVLFALDKLVKIRSDLNNIRIQLDDHVDEYSSKGVEFYMNRYINNPRYNISGVIMINNLSINNSDKPLVNNQGFQNKVILNFKQLNIKRKSISQEHINAFKRSFSNGANSQLNL